MLLNKEFFIRSIVTIIFGPLLLFLPFSGIEFYTGFTILIATVGAWEIWIMSKKISPLKALIIPGVIIFASYYSGFISSFIISILLLLILFTMETFQNNEKFLQSIGTIMLITVYTGYFIIFQIEILREFSPEYIILIFLTIWATDIFAYIGGSTYGRHKLCPTVSPKKSVEGALTGLIMGCSVGSIYAVYMGLFSIKESVIITAVVSSAGQLGDLFESKIKRMYNIKDSSKLIPGHGGVLDRFDSFIFATPFMYICVKLWL
ncbi:MAG: phosphatidate cytidylyltransferase [Candidatus Delongbacteria bacterium]|nr:phosphatidate cytidylyltransferase [Candidatus Delongbacteria bacterium]MBN2836462.1 phosphatidate cytidylyltransferase [Candidatus Delongbacteria bacterium]